MTLPPVPAQSPASSGRPTDRAAGDVATVLLVRMVVALIGAAASVIGAVLLFRHSVRPQQWGPYLGDAPVTIQRISTPWLVGATGLLLLAGLLVTAVAADLVRWRRLRRRDRGSARMTAARTTPAAAPEPS